MAIQFSTPDRDHRNLHWFLKSNYFLFEIAHNYDSAELPRMLYNLLFDFNGEGTLSQAEQLKLRNRLNEENLEMNNWKTNSELCFYINSENICLFLIKVLFEYLIASKTDKDTAIDAFVHSFSNWMSNSNHSLVIGSSAYRWLLHNIFMVLHADLTEFKRFPLQLRKIYQDALEIYPLDSLMWCYYVSFEHKCHAKQKLRTFFEQILKNSSNNKFTQNDSPIIWLHYLASEYFSDPIDNGRANRLRRMFERCLSVPSSTYENFFRTSTTTLHSPVIWRFYLKFEIEQSSFENAKKVFFRAVTSCPWCKKVWMDGIQLLWSYLSISEIIDIFDLMFEKGIYADLEFDSFSKYIQHNI
jgi:hypothetical protein